LGRSLHLCADEVGQSRCFAAIRHVGDLDARHHTGQSAGNMTGRADAARAHVPRRMMSGICAGRECPERLSKRQVFRRAKYGGNQNITRSANFSDGTATTTSHNNLSTTTYRKTVRRRREVAQTLQRLPADDRLRSPHPVTRTHPTDVGGPGASGLSLADALRRGPRRRLRRPYCNLALCKLASEITGLNVKSPTGSERTAPRRRLLLLLRGYLALRGSLFLRGGLRLCLLHHTALLAKSSGGVASAPTRIVGTASRLLQRSKKNIFHIKEPCMERLRARRRRGASRLAQKCCCMHPRRRLHHANNICKIT
jgi:hypothetical protein